MERVEPKFYDEGGKDKFKPISHAMKVKISGTVKALLHAHRDELRNKGTDTRRIRFDCTSGYYGEAFGVMRALVIQGFGYFGSSNCNAIREGRAHDSYQNVRWWFEQLADEVLEEENWKGSGTCIYCLEAYGKDDKSLYLGSQMYDDLTERTDE